MPERRRRRATGPWLQLRILALRLNRDGNEFARTGAGTMYWFKVPLGGVWVRGVWLGTVPVAAIIMCWLMVVPVAMDIIAHAVRGHTGSAWILGGYLLAGALMYLFYGLRNSRIGSTA